MCSRREVFGFDSVKMFLHVVVALFFGAYLIEFGSVMKFVFLPYLLFILFQHKAEYIPALMIIMSFGTVLTILTGFLMIPYCYKYRHELYNPFWRRLYKILLGMAPFFVLATANRMLKGMDFIEAITMNDYYVAFWFLLYGVVNRKFFNVRFLYSLLGTGIVLSFLVLILADLGSFPSLYRISNYFDMILIILICNNFFFRKIGNTSNTLLSFLLVIRILAYGSEYKFTFLFGLIIAIMALLFWRKRYQGNRHLMFVKGKFFPRLAIALPFIFLIITIVLTPVYGSRYSEVEIDYSFDKNIVEQILYKVFVDRGVIWMGAIDGILANTGILLPIENWNIEYTDVNNNKFEVDFESHNLILSLIKYNGYLFGTVFIVIYLSVMYLLYQALAVFRGMHGIYVVSLFGLGIAVFITGQYTLQLSTSFVFMALSGGLIGCSNYIQSNFARFYG